MFSKKPEQRTKQKRGGNLSQFGLFDVPNDLSFDNDMGDSDGGDSDLEAELQMLSGGGKPKRPARKKPLPNVDLDAMVAASIKDIGSDEELSGDDDDPDLLNELNEIAGEDVEPEKTPESPQKPATLSQGDLSKMLEERLKMYETAEANAKTAGESSRARRFNRGIKTLKDLIKQAKAGKPINDEDIPPVVSVTVRKPAADTPAEIPSPSSDNTPSPDAPPPPVPVRTAPKVPERSEPDVSESPKEETNSSNAELLNLLRQRKDEYKMAALKAKKENDIETAKTCIRTAKQFESVISAVEAGQPVDLSQMPGPPGEAPSPPKPQIEENKVQSHSEVPTLEMPEDVDMPEPELITAGSVLEALEQRLEVYKKQEAAAKEQNNSSKARRMGRIIKQFQDAIKAHKAGKPVPFDELPTPPGYAPIPGTETPKPQPQPQPSPKPPQPSPQGPSSQPSPSSPKKPALNQRSDSVRISGNHIPTTRVEKQIAVLIARQKEFKEAALNAKKKGEIAEAKEYLRSARGFDPLIEAARGGMPIDMATLPLPPSAKSKLDIDFDLVMKEECTEGDSENADVIHRLETQLTKQLKMCLVTRDHHKAMGDVAGMNRFETLALSVTKDLDLIRLIKKRGGAILPKFHYENKDFSIVKSNTDLNDNDLELTIVRGINYNCSNPKDIDTYVKYEFPYPQDEPVKDKTSTVKDTNNPEYNATVMFEIQRSQRACQRIFKRQAIKLEVYSKGGFFRSDTLMGTVNVKLQPLETLCEIHDSFDLLDGRKKVGGKLEVKIRVRDPLLTKQIENLHEKWLVLDH